MKILQICPAQRMVIEHDLKEKDDESYLDEFQDLVGGNIETAHIIDDNHRIFVNEEGLYESDRHYFLYNGAHQPFAGNGIIVTEDGTDHKLKVDHVFQNIRFFNELEMQVWLKLNCGEL